jgi:hypothetical protein
MTNEAITVGKVAEVIDAALTGGDENVRVTDVTHN